MAITDPVTLVTIMMRPSLCDLIVGKQALVTMNAEVRFRESAISKASRLVPSIPALSPVVSIGAVTLVMPALFTRIRSGLVVSWDAATTVAMPSSVVRSATTA